MDVAKHSSAVGGVITPASGHGHPLPVIVVRVVRIQVRFASEYFVKADRQRIADVLEDIEPEASLFLDAPLCMAAHVMDEFVQVLRLHPDGSKNGVHVVSRTAGNPSARLHRCEGSLG